jgi:hypothetical protein
VGCKGPVGCKWTRLPYTEGGGVPWGVRVPWGVSGRACQIRREVGSRGVWLSAKWTRLHYMEGGGGPVGCASQTAGECATPSVCIGTLNRQGLCVSRGHILGLS